MLQVAETTKGVIVLADSDEDGICAFRADRVCRYVYLVEDRVLLQQLGKLDSKYIIKRVAVKVDFRDVDVDTEGIDEVVCNG